MVSLADFQPRAKTNFSHQQPMFHRRIRCVTAPVSVDSNFVLNILDLSTNINRHLRSRLHLSLEWTHSMRLIRVFPQMNKVDSIYIICPSLAHSLWIFFHRFPTVFHWITTKRLSSRESVATETINQQSQGDSRSYLVYSFSRSL